MEADIQNVAKKYLLPENMITIAVGNRKAVESGLKAGGFGPVELLDPNATAK